jgi:hypothetical protein
MKVKVFAKGVRTDCPVVKTFDNVADVIDGFHGTTSDGKLVILGQNRETIAVFKDWYSWEMVNEKTEATRNEKTEDLVKKLSLADLICLKALLEKVQIETNDNKGVNGYGLWFYIDQELKRRKAVDMS